MKSQRGAALPEFALIALVFFALLFSAIEVGRWLFTWNTLVEATRRGARIAAVCPFFDDYIKIATVFGTQRQTLPLNSPILPGLNTNQVAIRYYSILDANNYDPPYTDLASANANKANIQLVEVGLDLNNNNWNYRFIAPIIGDILGNIIPPNVSTILPIESLGDRQKLTGTNANKCGT